MAVDETRPSVPEPPAPPKQGFVDLVTRIGDAQIFLQDLLGNLTNISAGSKRNKDVKITFVTGAQFLSPNDVFAYSEFGTRPGYTGYIVWMKSEDLLAARAAFDKEQDEKARRAALYTPRPAPLETCSGCGKPKSICCDEGWGVDKESFCVACCPNKTEHVRERAEQKS